MNTDLQKTNMDIQKTLKAFEPEMDNLIPILQAVQEFLGYISKEALSAIAVYLNISEADVYGVATFYTQFVFARPGDHKVKVCCGTACHVKNSGQIMDEVSKALGINPGETTEDYKFSIKSVACLGSCALAPVVVVDDNVHGRMTSQKAKKLIKDIK